jgi:hypothetical protein
MWILPFILLLTPLINECAILSLANTAFARWHRATPLDQCPFADVKVHISTLDRDKYLVESFWGCNAGFYRIDRVDLDKQAEWIWIVFVL